MQSGQPSLFSEGERTVAEQPGFGEPRWARGTSCRPMPAAGCGELLRSVGPLWAGKPQRAYGWCPERGCVSSPWSENCSPVRPTVPPVADLRPSGQLGITEPRVQSQGPETDEGIYLIEGPMSLP